MGKIIQLDKNLINQISAGEVVERPASVVKELVENAIDAGATEIKIEILQGGKKNIIIHDNGSGISKEDLLICLEKYTTSKIASLGDLYNILTFGFRGEALASISSVSEMSIISKTHDSLEAYKLTYSNETGKKLTQSSHSSGTSICVENLFYNTPARLNYLKQERTEYIKILSYLENIALSYPEIGFEFISDEKKIFKYQKNETLKTRMYHIYGNEMSDHLLETEFEMVGIKIKGLISDPKVNFQNKNKQHIFVNKRPISSIIISKAIHDAYNRFIPHGSYPAFVLNIDINPTQIDVNVHPRKLEIRFENEQNIFRCVYHAVLNKLESVTLTHPLGENGFLGAFQTEKKESSLPSPVSPSYYTGSGNNLKDFSPYKNTQAHPNQSQIHQALSFSKEMLSEEKIPNPFESGDLHYTKLGKIVGQAFQSYIITEYEGKIVILDQHALAERVLYEKLIKQDSKTVQQNLLIPESFRLENKDLAILEENNSIFQEMGFEIEILTNNIISIYSIPDFIKKENIEEIFRGVLQDIESGNKVKSNSLQEVKNKIFAYTACRSAIKFGNKLNLFEMNKLLNDASHEYSSTCPHGRPVIFEIGLAELKDKYER